MYEAASCSEETPVTMVIDTVLGYHGNRHCIVTTVLDTVLG